jgi:peptidoglycan/LPS O-acetylase OafA/YrhL
MRNNTHRIRSLDGMRGIAAVSVAIFHFLCAFAPQALPEFDRNPWPLSDTPLAILYNGGFAVSVFFVLSGYVISVSAKSSDTSLFARFLDRYSRLALPALASVLLTWSLLKLYPHIIGQLKQ